MREETAAPRLRAFHEYPVRFPRRMPEAMPQKAALPPAYSASSNSLVLARQARAEVVRDWLEALDQKRLALYGAGVAALTAYASLLALANSAAVSTWAMAAVFVAALTSSIAGLPPSRRFAAPCCSTCLTIPCRWSRS